eukprot:gene3670-4570_t
MSFKRQHCFLVILILFTILTVVVNSTSNSRIKFNNEPHLDDDFENEENEILELSYKKYQEEAMKESEYVKGELEFIKHLNTLPEEELKSVCKKMENSLIWPLRCVNNSNPLDPLRQDPTETIPFGRVLRNKFGITDGQKQLKPIVLVPGIAGSILEAKLFKQDVPAWYCTKQSDWFRLWLNLRELTVQSCWFDNLQLTYNITSDIYYNQPGVNIRPYDFGGTAGVAYLDYKLGLPVGITNVYGNMIKFFEDLGYTRSLNIVGAPFDWRLPIKELVKNGWMLQFKHLIESTYHLNGNKKVVLIAHSMGGMVSLHFLNSMTDAWKKEFIDSYIPIAVPWSGSPKAIRNIVSGDDFGISVVSNDLMRDFARQSGGVAQLVPDPLVWPSSQVFVKNGNIHYTASTMASLFSSMGLDSTAMIYNRVKSVLKGLTPKVRTYCLYGTGVSTEIMYEYKKGLNNPPLIWETTEGDGTVPSESLKFCKNWVGKNSGQQVDITEFPLADHVGILSHKPIFDYIALSEQENVPEYKPAKKVTIEELKNQDAEDESLRKYKETLLGKAVTGPSDDPRRVVVKELSILFEDRPEIVYPLETKEQIAEMKNKPFVLKENCHYKIRITFIVQHDIVSGLKNTNYVYRKGIRVQTEKTMLGSFAPQVAPYQVFLPRHGWEEAPSGILSRGSYTAKVEFTDDDNQSHLSLEYAFAIKSDWTKDE